MNEKSLEEEFAVLYFLQFCCKILDGSNKRKATVKIPWNVLRPLIHLLWLLEL